MDRLKTEGLLVNIFKMPTRNFKTAVLLSRGYAVDIFLSVFIILVCY